MTISIGGAYIRIWRPRRGLAAEVPAVVVLDQDGAIIALGDAAAQMEGKTSHQQQLVRSFFGDQIIHRDGLRALIRLALAKAIESDQARWWERLRLNIAVPPTVSPLHRDWLQRTVREAGGGWLNSLDPWSHLLPHNSQRRTDVVPVHGVLDWGFSGVRAALYVGDQLVASQSNSQWGLRQLCEKMVIAEQAKTHRLFPQSALYNQEWGLAYTGFDTAKARPILATLSAEVKQTTQVEGVKAIGQMLITLQNRLTPEQTSFLPQHGWLVVGGAANLFTDLDHWSQKLGAPLTVAVGPTYAVLKGLGD